MKVPKNKKVLFNMFPETKLDWFNVWLYFMFVGYLVGFDLHVSDWKFWAGLILFAVYGIGQNQAGFRKGLNDKMIEQIFRKMLRRNAKKK